MTEGKMFPCVGFIHVHARVRNSACRTFIDFAPKIFIHKSIKFNIWVAYLRFQICLFLKPAIIDKS